MYVVVWEFHVRDGSREEFEKHYGAKGTWAQLFGKGEGYLGTDLLRDAEKPGRYLTVDRWTSKAALENFKKRNRADYDALDLQCESLTDNETLVGAFVVEDD